ncbi:hypothetical protein NE237_018820 [Protea cynaroides]|uniref:Uncharacterized protein n=1 Tax=Protea cynaroides TaxID=273540 RepID=A0A9Q0KAL0_9MAGN|nr:hypothetical protein NE237_018820 [Protea cynaroides]
MRDAIACGWWSGDGRETRDVAGLRMAVRRWSRGTRWHWTQIAVRRWSRDIAGRGFWTNQTVCWAGDLLWTNRLSTGREMLLVVVLDKQTVRWVADRGWLRDPAGRGFWTNRLFAGREVSSGQADCLLDHRQGMATRCSVKEDEQADRSRKFDEERWSVGRLQSVWGSRSMGTRWQVYGRWSVAAGCGW